MKLLKRLAEWMHPATFTVKCPECGSRLCTNDRALALAALVDHLGHNVNGAAK